MTSALAGEYMRRVRDHQSVRETGSSLTSDSKDFSLYPDLSSTVFDLNC